MLLEVGGYKDRDRYLKRSFEVANSMENMVQEILRLKFRHPENFMPNRAFYQEVGINQMRWWDIFYGRKNINQEEYIALSKYFGITLEEAFAARQLCIFEEQ